MVTPLFTEAQDAFDFLSAFAPRLLAADQDAEYVMSSRDRVYARFGPVFREANTLLTSDLLAEFLSFDGNGHWTGLDRQRPNILGNFDSAKREIAKLVQRKELDDVGSRFDRADRTVKGFGEGIITPILHVAHPQFYGVWNDKTEEALKSLGIWIHVDRGDTKGRMYEKVNAALISVRNVLNKSLPAGRHPVDLWTIDYFWHAMRVLAKGGGLNELVLEFRRTRR